MKSPDSLLNTRMPTQTRPEQMYGDFFGLDCAPFSIAPNPRFLYMSQRHREALAHLLYGLQSDGGFVLLTGEVGTGKTTVCRCLLEQVPDDTNLAFIFNPKLTVQELLATICDELEISYPSDPSEVQSTKVFIDAITRYLLEAHGRGERTVLVIDEAQQLSYRVLEQLRLLTNLETNERKLLRIILLGQPELGDKLARPELRQLAQRITARFHLTPLSRDETRAYVRHRLSVAHGDPNIFGDASLARIHHLTQGVPRLINILCDRALLGAYVEDRHRVTRDIVKRAARELGGMSVTPVWKPLASAAAVILCVGISGTAAYYYLGHDEHFAQATNDVVASLTHADVSVAPATHQPAAEEAGQPAASENAPTADTDVASVETHGAVTLISRDTDDPAAIEPEWGLDWPASLPVEISARVAFAALFERWHTPFDAQTPLDACDYAMRVGLRCLDKSGNLRSVMELDRPAVLELFDESGMRYHAAVLAIRNDEADLVIGRHQVTAKLADVDARWRGHYTILWQMPPGYTNAVREGDRGETVEWLRDRLAELRMQPADPELRQPDLFDDELAAMVRDFQHANGLEADAIAGAHTWIKLNDIVGVGVPRIVEQ